MNTGLSATHLAIVRAVLAQFAGVERAVLYGSRAMGTYRTGSDIDLTLYGAGLDSRKCAAIWGAFDESRLPHRVDVSVFALLHHEGLKDHIRRVGVVLFDRQAWDAEQLGHAGPAATPASGL